MGVRGTWWVVGAVVVSAVGVAARPVAAEPSLPGDVPPVARAGESEALEAAWFAEAAVPPAGPAVSFGAGGLEALVPARLLDTRDGTGAPPARIGAGGVVELSVTGRGGVPATGVSAVVLNVTAVAPTAASFVTVWPTGAKMPTASNLNVVPGDVVPNLVVVKVGRGGSVSLYNAFGEVDLVADVAGWFPEGSALEPLVPARVLDTRDGTGVRRARVGAGGVVDLQVTGRGGVPASGVGAVVMNVTAVAPTEASVVTVWPSGTKMPTASNLNMVPGDVIPNLVVVKVGTGGRVSLANAFGEVDLVADVAGWFPDGGGFEPLVPARVLDTRDGTGVRRARVGAGGVVDLQVTGRGGVPASGVGAVVMNVTSVAPTEASVVTVWPSGTKMPLASNLNLVPGDVRPNLVVVKVGSGGRVSLGNAFGEVDLVADVAGWFPDGAAASTTLVPARTTVLAGPGDVVSVTPGSAGASVVLSASADVPAVGGHLVVFPHAAVPDGASGTATRVAGRADGTTLVVLERAPLGRMFADLRIEGTVSAPHDPAGDPDRQTFQAAAPAACRGAVSLSASPVSGQFAFKLRDRYVRLLLEWSPTLRTMLPSGASAGLSCSFQPWKRLRMGVVGPMLLKSDAELTLDVSAAVEGSLTALPKVGVGFEYADGQLEDLSTAHLSALADLVGGGSVSGTAQVSVGLDLDVTGALFDLGGPQVSVGPQVTATIDLADECVVIESSIAAAAELTVEKWWIEWSVQIAEVTFGPFEVARFNCGQKMWTGTLTATVHRDSDRGTENPRGISDENATYVLQPTTGLRPDGSGRYGARITASGEKVSYWPVWDGAAWQHCRSNEESWALDDVLRQQAVAIERDDDGGWRYQPFLVSTAHYPPYGQIGGATGTFVSYPCGDPLGDIVVTPWTGTDNFTKLGWEDGTSLGTGRLNDTDPAPDRLVGTTTWTRADPPTPGTLFDATTTWVYSVTYDLTRVEVPTE